MPMPNRATGDKLIEVQPPLDAVNNASAREKRGCCGDGGCRHRPIGWPVP